MTEQADAFAHVDKSVIDGVSKILASQKSKDMGLDLNYPIIMGVYNAPEGLLVRFHATDVNKAMKGVDAVLKELNVANSSSVSAQAKEDALWVFFTSRNAQNAMESLFAKAKFSSDLGFPKICPGADLGAP